MNKINFIYLPGMILGMGSANENRRYNVTSVLIGWAHIQNDPCKAVCLECNCQVLQVSFFKTTLLIKNV